MKKMKSKLIFMLILCLSVLIGFAKPVDAAISDPAIYSIVGTVFTDTNENGVYELPLLEVPQTNKQVALYRSLADAEANVNPVKSVKTNGIGAYNFSRLTVGTYFIKYGIEDKTRPIVQKKTALNPNGEPVNGVVQVEITAGNLVNITDLATKKIINLTMTVFEDLNMNGVMDSSETILDGKTLIFIDLIKTKAMLDSGDLGKIDLVMAVLNAVGGSIDVGNGAMAFRTTANGKVLDMPDIDAGMYVMIRSPFNLTLNDLMGNVSKIQVILDIVEGKDMTEIINHPELISTGDITTTYDNDYLKKVVSFLPKAINTIDSLDTGKYLGTDVGTNVDKILGDARGIVKILNNIPAMRFAKVDIFGNSYDLTGFKVVKTTDFRFGVRSLASISGTVFNDINGNGTQNSLELSKSISLTAYNEQGEVLRTITTPEALGGYKIDQLPYDTTIYLVAGGENPISPRYEGEVPSIFDPNRVVGVYNFASADPNSTVKQTIGLSIFSQPGMVVKSQNAANQTAVVTFSNKNSGKLNVNYSLNGGEIQTTTVNAKNIFGGDAKKDVTLTNLQSGTNSLKVYWTAGPYKGKVIEFFIEGP
ncbi:hypothetical protein ACWOFR_05410 [Carnobacterium gallinarum]|uniref:hypothetical protein n=1 Tax=Carnobacterium gallinarum TaxID=2749 RepID=UPI000552865A|nr:hypothetical protein [Carnobacterium gallinarum]